MSKLINWCQAMASTTTGLIALSNLIHDIVYDRLPEDILSKLFSELEGSSISVNPGRKPIRIILSITGSAPDSWVCHGRPSPPAPLPCSRVIDEVSFIYWNLLASAYHMPYTDEIPESVMKEIEAEGFSPSSVKGEMKGARGFAWVTPSQGLMNIYAVTEYNKRANVVRDSLGLDRYISEDRLLEIRYPEEVWSKLRLSPPTFIEGCPGLVYRSKLEADGWGRTVDLRTMGDGLKEAVHLPVNFTENFKLAVIGEISGVHRSFEWTDLLDRCPRRWSEDDVKILEGLLHGSSS